VEKTRLKLFVKTPFSKFCNVGVLCSHAQPYACEEKGKNKHKAKERRFGKCKKQASFCLQRLQNKVVSF
jgi:hypothetical protein